MEEQLESSNINPTIEKKCKEDIPPAVKKAKTAMKAVYQWDNNETKFLILHYEMRTKSSYFWPLDAS